MSHRNRSTGGSSRNNTNSKKSTATASSKTPPPSPFTAVPTILTPLLELLETRNVYITHVDEFPWRFKRRIFAVPVLLNLSIVALLLWRAWSAWPTYVGMVYFLFSTDNDRRRDWGDSWAGLVFLVVKRVIMVFIDYTLLRVIGSWPLTFFFEGPANPCSWRWNVGFRDQEVVVRVSRGWGTEDLVGVDKVKRGKESPFWKTRVLPAVEEGLVKGKTGYALMGRDWDLDFRVMIAVTKMVNGAKFGWADMSKPMVFAWDGVDGGRWVMWSVGAETVAGGKENVLGGPVNLDSADQEEARHMMEKFRDKLLAKGKEDLFYRWVELMQYEAGQGSTFTAERQEAAVERVRQLFREHGVDYGEFLKDAGALPTGAVA